VSISILKLFVMFLALSHAYKVLALKI